MLRTQVLSKPDAPRVKILLHEAILAAERLDVLEAREAKRRAPEPRVDEPVKEAEPVG